MMAQPGVALHTQFPLTPRSARSNRQYGYHSARRGAYRVVYRINEIDRVVHVVRIDHRADVYRTR